MRLILVVISVLLFTAGAYTAQTDLQPVTDDQVNAIANRLFCPVCENIPLDTCGTAACQDWREEIRMMLANGMNDEEIVADFVIRFGDRVVGSPRDPILRAISLVTPWLVLILAAVVAGMTIRRGRDIQKSNRAYGTPVADTEKYQELLEQDLTG